MNLRQGYGRTALLLSGGGTLGIAEQEIYIEAFSNTRYINRFFSYWGFKDYDKCSALASDYFRRINRKYHGFNDLHLERAG